MEETYLSLTEHKKTIQKGHRLYDAECMAFWENAKLSAGRGRRFRKFKVILRYIPSSKPAWVMSLKLKNKQILFLKKREKEREKGKWMAETLGKERVANRGLYGNRACTVLCDRV